MKQTSICLVLLLGGFMPSAKAAIKFIKIGENNSRNSSIDTRSGSLKCGMGPIHGYSIGTRVVRGRDAKPGEFPFQVFLDIVATRRDGTKSKTYCGGSIIDEWHILSAAHCLHQCDWQASRVVAFLGKHTFDTKGGEQKLIDKYKVHEKFECDSGSLSFPYDDIALLRVKERMNFQLKPGLGSINSVCLPHYCDWLLPGRKVVVPGWGMTKFPNETPQVLQVAAMRIEKFNKCTQPKDEYLDTAKNFCLISEETTVCHGDSGGPVVRLVNGIYQIIGIVSFGRAYCPINAPSGYTRVQNYLGWIEAAKNELYRG